MGYKKTKGILLDADYRDLDGGSRIRLFVKTAKGMEAFFDPGFHPYFYAKPHDAEKAVAVLKSHEFEEGFKARSVEEAKNGLLRVEFNATGEVRQARKQVAGLSEIDDIFEYDIPFAKRYLLDKQLEPMAGIELELEGSSIMKVRATGAKGKVNYAAFDIETLSPERFSNPKKDPILMISLALEKKEILLTTNPKLKGGRGVKVFESEKEMLQAFLDLLGKEGIDVLVTYNGDGFDLPYVKERAKALGMRAGFPPLGEEPSIRTSGPRDEITRLHGIQHLDAYKLLRFLNRFAVVNLIKFDLESVSAALFGEEKEKITASEINRIWKTGKGLKKLAAYCIEDSKVALKIGLRYSPLVLELGKLVKLTMFDVSRASASVLVERLLMNKAFVENRVVPNKPEKDEAKQRMMQSYAGGYVKEPVPGLHENLAVLDFSSLHPSIMISHNISPETLDCGHKECEKNAAPTKHFFCTKEEGFLSGILKELFETRMGMKKKLKAAKKKSEERLLLDARQHSLKILMNSFYGYLGYARSRWFSRECAAAITAWSRQYVQQVLDKAVKKGFTALYGDTDSAFLIIPKEKKKEDVEKFVEEINADLPGVMNLELEGFFRRGIFVTKESGEGAKKKYALIDYEGNLKIVGFEYVRRDWSTIAKETQRNVIAAVLAEGNPEKAAKIVKEAIQRLKKGRAENQELVVLTQLKRPLAKYAAIGPHVAAAKKAVAKGKEMEVGSVIGYIITRSGKSISDKAQLEEYVKEGNYDADYYIEHQVVPAVIKIMRELGYTKEDLVQGGKQSKLGAFG